MTRTTTLLLFSLSLFFACNPASQESGAEAQSLRIQQDESVGTISVFYEKGGDPLVVQNAKPDFRPFIHPLAAPDGKGQLTEYSPGHHRHQTGLYWGFTRVNGSSEAQDSVKKYFYQKDKPAAIAAMTGRDFFHHPDSDYWRRVSATVLTETGPEVKWKTVYEMLDAAGNALMQETQTWSMRAQSGKFFLTLEWEGKALQDITINEFDYGGLFLRMPWREGIDGEVVNTARQRNERAEGQRAMWVDVGMQVEGREDQAHIAIFDHPENGGFPQPWRVDGQMGVGPVRARLGDWHIEKGQIELIRHQIVAYTGQIGDIEMKKLWDEYSGAGSMYSTASLWGIAQEEGRNAKFLTPQEAVESMTLIDGFQVNAWAAEPMITQPMAFCWDDRGRMWIAENRDYESRVDGFSNSGDSRILILEDTDGDGVADSRKVFLEGVPFPAAIAVGFDGLYLGAPPNLLFVPDRNQDDRADVDDIEVRLTGWGIRDRHETINSLHWGPDGWLYGLEGFATPSKIRKPQGKGRLYSHKEPFPEDLLEGEGIDINGGVWRYHPTKDRFEVVAHGFSNPWGIDYDAKGQLFISACVIPHLFHVIPGGIYHRQGGQHFNPYVYSDIQTIVDHRHRSAHGGARIYQSDAFPEPHQGRLFMANIHEHAVLSDILEPKGSGFVARHGDDFLLANNAQWIGFSMEVGPEGALYVLDWHDADICGKEVLNKETGRIFRITPETSLAQNWEGRYGDLTQLSDEKLAALQTSPSDWHARRARVILQYRATKGAIGTAALASLRELFRTGKNADHRLRGLWTLHVAGALSAAELSASLADKDPYVRAWAIQLLCEDGEPAAEVLDKFAQMAAKDASPVVRLYLAAALQRIDADNRWAILAGLNSHPADADDPNLPDMLWFAMEPLAAADPNRALALASESALPKIRQHAARRAVDGNALETLVTWLDKRGPAQQDFLKGMNAGLEGRFGIKAPANWAAVYKKLQSDKVAAPLAQAVAQQFGDSEAAQQALATLANKKAPIEQRRTALGRLAAQRREPLIAELPALFDEPQLRPDAIRAIAAYDNENLGRLLMERYATLTAAEKAEAVQTLASRPRYGRMLTQALKEARIPKSDVPAYAARQLRRVVGNGFVEVWGPIDQLPGDKDLAYRKYRSLLSEKNLATADMNQGAALFERTCAACHQLYGEGGNIGPDLTGSNRNNIEYLLSNILDPSGEIQDDYRMVVITTRDGRTFAGNVAAETDRQLTLRVVGQEPVVINLSEIQSRETTPVSMMPEGLLANLSDQEVVDLVGYLRGRVE